MENVEKDWKHQWFVAATVRTPMLLVLLLVLYGCLQLLIMDIENARLRQEQVKEIIMHCIGKE
jgi:hypothetical protein